ncbi:MAG: oligosaccharide flippase family protein, partial [Candidatus Hodarchaeota archaeon]
MEARHSSKIITKNYIWSFFTTGLNGLTVSIYPLLVAFLFSEILFATYGIVTSWVLLLSLPISNGIAPALTKYISSYEEKFTEAVINSSYFIITPYFLLIAGFSLLLVWFETSLSLMIGAIFILMCLNSLRFQFRKIIQGMEKFKLLAFLEVSANIIFVFSVLPAWQFVNSEVIS